MSIAELLDPDFTIERVAFTVKDFLKLTHQELPKGSCVILDEAGLAVSQRTFFSQLNRCMSYLLQSHRYQNYVILINVPNPKMIDIDLRRLAHAVIETLFIDYKKQQTHFKFLTTQVNLRSNKLYYKLPVSSDGYNIYKIREFSAIKPSKNLIVKYEKKKEEYLRSLRKGLIKSLETKHSKSKKQLIMSSLDKGLSVQEAAKKYHTSTSYIYNIKSDRKQHTE